MHNLPIPHIWLGNSHFLPIFLAKLQQALQPMEDQWTWSTQEGRWFEDVDVERIQADDVIFYHKFGKIRLPIASLSEDAQRKLYRGLGRTVAPSTPPGGRRSGR